MAGMLAVFAEFERDILRDRLKAGIDQARKEGNPHGRPQTAGKLVPEMKKLRKDGLSKRAIAHQLGVSRSSVIRLLGPRKRSTPFKTCNFEPIFPKTAVELIGDARWHGINGFAVIRTVNRITRRVRRKCLKGHQKGTREPGSPLRVSL